jgi:ArsR family transcriptional regulator, arsenate/arsenite/antimonite-responsive transcriptional repressor
LEATVRDIAEFFKVLADETRLKMLWLLFNHRELCVCDILGALGISQSKASRHLATMRHAGLVSDRRAGLWAYYAIRPVENKLEQEQMAVLRENLAAHPDAARVLEELHKYLRRNGDEAPCSDEGVCGAKPARKTARVPRARVAGGAR